MTKQKRKEFASAKQTKGGFPTALPDSGSTFSDQLVKPRCAVELSIEAMESSIRDKPEWWIKIHDSVIVQKWKKEILQANNNQKNDNNNGNNNNNNNENEDSGFSEESIQKQFQYALDECLWLASEHNGGNNLSSSHPAAAHGVFGCDDINPSLLKSLVSGISILRSRPAIGSTKEDRHPGTPQMVDLVHPSLYCYKRGVTNVSKVDGANIYVAPPWESFIGMMNGATEPLPPPPRATRSEAYTSQTRMDYFTSKAGVHWLPAECRVIKTNKTTTTADDEEPKKKKTKREKDKDKKEENAKLECKFQSYINNLHPKQYPKLYESLGQLFCHAIPLLEDVLRELGTRDKQRERPLRIEDRYPNWEGEPREMEDDEDYDAYYEYFDDFNENQRIFRHPDVPKFTPPKFKYVKANISLLDRPLQVIVKIASLELQPKTSSPSGEGEESSSPSSLSSSYDGGVWHVEGTLDERIVATACCYVDCENVQGGNLEFRRATDIPDYEQDDRKGVWEMYRMKDGDPLAQPCGTSTVRTGRILAWPNTLQHRVGPVRLIDESKPGHRTIICFFLVDPTLRIRSTATVPPQQKEWFQQELHYLFFKKFPKVITSHICNFLPSFMSFEDACQRRDELMEERKANDEKDKKDNIEVYNFSLCEH